MTVDIQAIVEQTANQMIGRLNPATLGQEEYQENCTILFEFNKIAATMLNDEPGIEMPGSGETIPMDEQLQTQALVLFSEGVYYAIVKCAEMGITGDLKRNLMQNLAMEIYNQSKQIMVATFGQEHTPEFQFSHEQQVDIICKATEGHLVAYVTEYESVNGPIQPPEPQAGQLVEPQPEATPQQVGPSSSVAGPKEEQAAQTPIPSQGKTTPHDKYGAVALLLTTLPTNQRDRILKGFTAEEKGLIEYYSHPQHLEQNLDLANVEIHLKQFRELLKKSGASGKNTSQKGIVKLLENHSAEKLLSCVKDERPLVKRYLESRYLGQVGRSGGSVQPQKPFIVLPPRIEEILYKHLVKRLESS